MMKAGTTVSAKSGIPLVLANRFPEEGRCDPARAFLCALLLLWVFCSSSQRSVCSLGLPHLTPLTMLNRAAILSLLVTDFINHKEKNGYATHGRSQSADS